MQAPASGSARQPGATQATAPTPTAPALERPSAAGTVLLMLGHAGITAPSGAYPELTRFQEDAAHRLQRIMALRGGAVLADSVGLGKTHVALAIIRQHVRDGGTATVVAPAALRAHWQRHLRGVRSCRFLSHSALSRASAPLHGTSLVVVDEAHAFRNPRTRRYTALARLCTGSTVLLITATPVNNSLLDFYHLLRLFARDDSFGDVGVPDLRSATQLALDGAATEPLRNVARHVMVRRSRAFIERHYGIDAGTVHSDRKHAAPAMDTAHARAGQPAPMAGAGSSPPDPLRFPAREPLRAVRYELGAAYPHLDRALADALARLTFPVHAATACASASGSTVPADLLRMGMLKRLESSTAAFATSLRGYERLLHEFISASDTGHLLDVRSGRRFLTEVDGSVQLTMRGVVLRPWPASMNRAEYVARAGEDLRHVQRLRTMVTPGDNGCGRGANCTTSHDTATPEQAGRHAREPKLSALQALLPEFAGERILIFTEYRHTARMLWRALASLGGVGLIAGDEARLGTARCSRQAVLRRFTDSGRRRTPRHQQVRILIATDVLSEGLNLQQARVVISYDVPWNPVRLAQRIGRIDRLGSPHRSIVSVVFVPDRRLDAVLRLMDRIRRKMRHIRIVGGDTPWPAGSRRQAARLLEGEALELEPRLRVAWRQARDAGVRESAVPTAVRWDGPQRGALVCVSNGDRARLVLCREGAAPEVDGTGPEAVALAILEGRLPAAGAAPDPAWLDRVGRQALRTVRDAIRRRGSGNAAVTIHAARAARRVHRWLRGRPAGGSRHDLATAERVLAWLASPLPADAEHRLRQLLEEAGSDDQLVEELDILVTTMTDLAARVETRVGGSVGGRMAAGPLSVLAAIELVPRPVR